MQNKTTTLVSPSEVARMCGLPIKTFMARIYGGAVVGPSHPDGKKLGYTTEEAKAIVKVNKAEDANIVKQLIVGRGTTQGDRAADAIAKAAKYISSVQVNGARVLRANGAWTIELWVRM